MDVGARALQEQVPRKYLPVRPVHRRYICMDAVYADFAGAKIGPASCLSRHTVRPVHKKGRRRKTASPLQHSNECYVGN